MRITTGTQINAEAIAEKFASAMERAGYSPGDQLESALVYELSNCIDHGEDGGYWAPNEVIGDMLDALIYAANRTKENLA